MRAVTYIFTLVYDKTFGWYFWWFRNPKQPPEMYKTRRKQWDKLPTSTGEFTGFLNHQQSHKPKQLSNLAWNQIRTNLNVGQWQLYG